MRAGVRFSVLGIAALLVAGTVLLDSSAQDKAKYTIKEVMKKAHKEALLKTVVSGKATKEQKDSLVEMYTALTQNTPPKGAAASWKDKTGTLVAAAKDAAKDAKGAGPKLQKAADCKGCHSAHK